MMSFTSDSELAEKALEEEDIEMINTEVKQILKECMKKIEEEVCEIETNEFEAGMRKWRETTSTSPSGRHLGIYKCFIKQGDQEEETEHVLRILTEMVNTTFKNGYCLSR